MLQQKDKVAGWMKKKKKTHTYCYSLSSSFKYKGRLCIWDVSCFFEVVPTKTHFRSKDTHR